MKRRHIIYLIISIMFIIVSSIIISKIDHSSNVALSKAIQIILILYLVRISIGCTFYIKEQYEKQKYSYSIIMNLGLVIFININILRMIDLLIFNWKVTDIVDIYNNTIESFSFFAMLTLPCIIILSIYSIITNFVLIIKEGFRPRNFLGIFLGFLAILGLIGSQTIYMITSNLVVERDALFFKRLIDICLNVNLSYLYTLIIATLYCNIRASRHIPNYDKDFVIILGSKIKDDGTLTPLLKGRVDKALEFGKNQYDSTKKKIYYVPSGGKGSDEVISEAEAIKNYLISIGIDKKQIILEDKSTSTIENMKFSKEKIEELNKNAKICFSTTNYHVFRSGVIANECGIDCEGMGSNTKWYFYSNALIREFIANIVQEKWRHISLILIMNFTSLILLLIGYYYNFIYIFD